MLAATKSGGAYCLLLFSCSFVFKSHRKYGNKEYQCQTSYEIGILRILNGWRIETFQTFDVLLRVKLYGCLQPRNICTGMYNCIRGRPLNLHWYQVKGVKYLDGSEDFPSVRNGPRCKLTDFPDHLAQLCGEQALWTVYYISRWYEKRKV